MLHSKARTAVTAALVLCLVGAFGCNKKKTGQPDPGSQGSSSMDTAPPPGMPVEMAPDPMRMIDPSKIMDNMEPDSDPGPDPTIPQKGQATARMILIGWKDSAVPADVKRTKTEARAIAEKVLKEARAKPGDEKHFVKLVKKYADAFKETGGKVGPFSPKEGLPYIVKAVFPLKVGGVSAIVETKAGFHIFMRTR